MKKNYKFIKALFLSLATAGMMTFSACKDYLDVENPSTLSQEAVFNSVNYTSSALTAIYGSLMGDDGYGSRISTLYPNAADDFRVGGAYNPLDRRGISGFGVHPDNTELFRPFLQLYQGIERANVAIRFIPASPLYEGGDSRRTGGDEENARGGADPAGPFLPRADPELGRCARSF